MFRQVKRRSDEVGSVLFYHVSTRKIFENAIGFEGVAGVREGSNENLALVEVRSDDLRENPARWHQTGSRIPERCLMFLTIGPASGGRQQSGKYVGNTGNHSGKLLPVWCRHGGTRPKSSRLAWISGEASRRELP